MDLIGQLAQTVGIENDQAEALAGKVLGSVKEQVASEDAGAASALGDAVPELGGWEAKAAGMLDMGGGGGGGGLGGLLGGAAKALGGDKAEDTVAIVSILSKFNVDAGKAALVAPLVLKFLQSRMEPGTLDKVLKFAPMLAGAKGGDGGGLGGLMGAAKGLF